MSRGHASTCGDLDCPYGPSAKTSLEGTGEAEPAGSTGTPKGPTVPFYELFYSRVMGPEYRLRLHIDGSWSLEYLGKVPELLTLETSLAALSHSWMLSQETE